MQKIKKMEGRFIVCEGTDCAGKTTAIDYAAKYLKNNSAILYSRGLKTKTIAGKISSLFPSTLTLLIEQLYLDNLFIKPNLGAGKTIIQDRGYYSVLSYNPESKLEKLLEKLFVPFLSKPDLLVYFTTSLEERLKRLRNKDREHQKLSKEPATIQRREERMREYYDNFQGSKSTIDTTSCFREESGYKLYDIISSFLHKQQNL